MKTKLFNYRIIVESEMQENGEKSYVAYAPTLGISDFGSTIEEAVTHMETAIKLYIEALVEQKQSVPDPDTEDYFVTSRKIAITMPLIQ